MKGIKKIIVLFVEWIELHYKNKIGISTIIQRNNIFFGIIFSFYIVLKVKTRMIILVFNIISINYQLNKYNGFLHVYKMMIIKWKK